MEAVGEQNTKGPSSVRGNSAGADFYAPMGGT